MTLTQDFLTANRNEIIETANEQMTAAFRIPISKIEEVEAVVNRMLSGYAENNVRVLGEEADKKS